MHLMNLHQQAEVTQGFVKMVEADAQGMMKRRMEERRCGLGLGS